MPPQNVSVSTEIQPNESTDQTELSNRVEVKKLLGLDTNEVDQLKINFHEELKVTWTQNG